MSWILEQHSKGFNTNTLQQTHCNKDTVLQQTHSSANLKHISTHSQPTTNTMSLTQTYVMASKVRVKLAKQAANPKSSLRLLVLQANMLDRLMDDIAVTSQKKAASKVTFSVPPKKKVEEIVFERTGGPNVTEYEVDSDSDDDDDDYSYSSSDSEENLFDPELDDYLSDSDDDEPVVRNELLHTKSKSLPVLADVSDGQLLIVFEADEDVPELTGLNSTSSDSDSEDELTMPTYALSRTTSPYPVELSKLPSGRVSVEDISFHPQQESAAFTIGKVY